MVVVHRVLALQRGLLKVQAVREHSLVSDLCAALTAEPFAVWLRNASGTAPLQLCIGGTLPCLATQAGWHIMV